MFLKSLLVLVALSVSEINGQIIVNERCQKVETIKEFKPTEYCGVWYAYEGYLGADEVGQSCYRAEYTFNSNGTLDVVIRKKVKGIYTERTGQGVVVKGGYLQIELCATDSEPAERYLWAILGTDYENWASVYDCRNLRIGSERRAYVMTNKPIPRDNDVKKGEDIFRINKISVSKMTQICQNDC